MKKFTLLLLLLVYCSFASVRAYAGTDPVVSSTTTHDGDQILNVATPDEPTRNRWILGGGLGFSWGTYEWSMLVSPQLGYQVTDRLVLGGGISYSFYKGRGGFNYKANNFAINGFAEFYPVRNFFIFAKPEINYQWWRWAGHEPQNRGPFFCMPVGAGYVVRLGGSVDMVLSLWYDVVQNRYTPYGDKIGYSLGFRFRL